jgi:hypothetical protein
VVQVNFVDTDDFASENIDHLLVEQITAQQEQTLPGLSQQPFRGSRGGSNAAIDGGYGAKRQQAVAGLGSNDDHSDASVIFLGSQSQLANAPAAAASKVENWFAQQFRECEHRHRPENTQVSNRNPDGLKVFVGDGV